MRKLAVVAACGLALKACTGASFVPEGARAVVKGEVRAPYQLQADAVVYVALAKLTETGETAVLIDEQNLRPPGPGPVPFELVYDQRRIDPNDTFGVRARVLHLGRLLYASDPVRVITHGNPSEVTIVTEVVGAAPSAPAAPRAPVGKPEPDPEPAPSPDAEPEGEREEVVEEVEVRPARTPAPPPAPAAKPELVRFPLGGSAVALTGRVEGFGTRDYAIDAKARQTLGVRMEARSPFVHFAVRAGDDVLFDSSRAPSRGWQGSVPRGDVVLRVFLALEEAERRGGAEYALQIELH